MKKICLYFTVFTLILLGACQSSNNSENVYQKEVTGQAGDVIVVMPKGKWDGAPGSAIRNVLNQPEIGLPQDEPVFDPIFIPTDGFGALYRSQRNILIAKIGPKYNKKEVVVKKGVYAKSQLVITIEAPSDSAFTNLVKANGHKISQTIKNTERTRLMETYARQQDKNLVLDIQKNYNIKLKIPRGYNVNKQEDDFIWLESSYRDIIENLVIYTYPYVDDSTFTKKFQVEKRNQFVKRVPGAVDGSFVGTEERAPIYFNVLNLNDNYTAEIRGLWRMWGGMAMGGPFISISQYDKANQRIVTVEGFVFAPSHKKRNYIRRAEAILYSLELAGTQ